ncbi:MAG TPA: 4-(cytidine 5'-diphospho)-2-C-methyl-D-erythritol kinase [Acidimicrobiia bacterium]|nr:4-(cytidine 5'-diphospho)-2-C-methyl-D-erythritol kinase [Acidimicrobiia bacterium]
MRLTRVRATAYPKLTLSLRVLGRREDGFHDLDSLVVSLGQPYDVIEAYAVPAPGGVQVEVVGDDAAADVPADHRNLAFVAAERLLVRAGRSGHGVRLVLRKQIPAGAGLGGGSADAAAALLAVRRLLDVDVDDDGVSELAAAIGSDVSFCVRGGAAWMRGRGDVIDDLALPQRLAFVVAIPPFRLSTQAVYRRWDELGGPRATRAIRAPRRIAALLPELANDLEPAAESLEPRLVEFRTALEGAAGSPALLAGSGSAYVVPVADARAVPELVAEVTRRLRVPVVGTTTVSRGVRLA